MKWRTGCIEQVFRNAAGVEASVLVSCCCFSVYLWRRKLVRQLYILNDPMADDDAWYGLHCRWKSASGVDALARFHVVQGLQACNTEGADNQGRHHLTCLPHCLYHFTTTALHSVTGSRNYKPPHALARKCLLEERPRPEHETAHQAPINDPPLAITKLLTLGPL